MDISTDELRRQVRESEAEHKQSMKSLKEVVGRLFEGESNETAQAKANFFLNGLNRRRFLQVGGVSILTSAVLAACGSSSSSSSSSGAAAGGGSTATSGAPSADAGLLRLSSSLEHYAVGLYMTAAASGLVKTQAIADAATYFASQHSDHANFFEKATSDAGGQPFTTANQAVAAMLKPRVDALKTEADVVKLAYDVESAAAATYFSTVGGFKDLKLNAAAMSVGGIEARHVAVLGLILSGLPKPVPGIAARTDSSPYAKTGFQTKDGAVPAGTGV